MAVELQHEATDDLRDADVSREDDPPCGLEDCYRRYSGYVASIGLRLLGRHEEVDDLVQDVFLAAMRGLDQLRERQAVKGWLATVTVRLATRRLRARKVRYFLGMDSNTDYHGVADTAASPEDRAVLSAVYRVLDGVPVSDRVAWSLRYVEGEKLTRVAALCNCSLATAKRRISATQSAIQQAVGHV